MSSEVDFIIFLLACKPGDVTNLTVFAKVSRSTTTELLLMPFYTSLNANISGIRKDSEKRSQGIKCYFYILAPNFLTISAMLLLLEVKHKRCSKLEDKMNFGARMHQACVTLNDFLQRFSLTIQPCMSHWSTFTCHAMSVGSSRGQAKACHIARFSSAPAQFQAILQFSLQNKASGSPQASRKDFVSQKTAIAARQIDAERVILTNLTQMQATSLQVFELKSKTRNVLPLFRIRRKSFAMACHITLLSVATSY